MSAHPDPNRRAKNSETVMTRLRIHMGMNTSVIRP